MRNHDLRIGLIELYATEDGTLWGNRMKDLYSIVRLPARATELLAAILRKNGFSRVKTLPWVLTPLFFSSVSNRNMA